MFSTSCIIRALLLLTSIQRAIAMSIARGIPTAISKRMPVETSTTTLVLISMITLPPPRALQLTNAVPTP
ncbi:hypothetical protein GCM10023184_32210 [Flaviaesturariibacter amylovorans]|uniref:Secreted protein n=1 Tax=Flaviaesturariibacter amylovorans TaxID=1084520 RepID=A0ABP8HBT0_9BACT